MPPLLLPSPPQLEFAFEVRLELGLPLILKAASAGVDRAAIYVQRGSFEGPRLRGKVIEHSGGDWARLRHDGVLDFDARYLLQTDDGTLIYMTNQGYRWSSPEVMQKLMRGEAVDPGQYYMRVAPRFEVEQGPYDWLSRHVFIGVGEKLAVGNVIRYFTVL